MVRRVSPSVSAASASLMAGPCSPSSTASRIEAWRRFWAATVPLWTIAWSASRSSAVSLTTYFLVLMGMAAALRIGANEANTDVYNIIRTDY